MSACRNVTEPTASERHDGERLQKVLARTGLGSRRACEELIAAGRVSIDGRVARLGERVDPEHSSIEVDGVLVATRAGLVYYLLNKPARVVTSARDPQGRRTVLDLVPREPRVFPVGRLDYDTEGLLVVTNDGDLAQRLVHPRYGLPKTYLAEIVGRPSPGALRRLRGGVELDGERTGPAQVRLVQAHGASVALEIVIHEGRNRQVRRMCEAVGHPVRRLVRTRIGPLGDSRLEPGAWRSLRQAEVRSLYEATAAPRPAKAPSAPRGGH